jgi:hypothetical protein
MSASKAVFHVFFSCIIYCITEAIPAIIPKQPENAGICRKSNGFLRMENGRWKMENLYGVRKIFFYPYYDRDTLTNAVMPS